MDLKNREAIKSKNAAKKAAPKANRPKGFKSASDAHEANQARAKMQKPASNRIDY